MERRRRAYRSIDEYIRSFPGPVRAQLRELRNLIRRLAPDAQEKISYQIPTFTLHGNLVHFAAFANHIGLYPGSSGVRAFESKLTRYKHSKGAIQFPLDEPLPVSLITQIVKFRVKESLAKKPHSRVERSD
jgi:uncharacterized protein YdhG (YjbR/CyaY superfamily)